MSLEIQPGLPLDPALAQVLPEKIYQGVGGARTLWDSSAPEVLVAGPAGTGKSRAVLEKLNFLALRYPGARILVVRKTRESLLQSGLVTLQRDVLVEAHARYFRARSEFHYRNSSVIVLGGLDKVSKIMSAEYDVIYVQEATEVTEEEWEHLTTRLRGSVTPDKQIIGCANPAGPNHWLKKRAEAGRLVLVTSAFEDNPLLYDKKTSRYSSFGESYLAKLDALTGVRYQRLRLGLWVQAEGMVYEDFDWNHHVVDRFTIPKHWARYWAIDFGFTNPFVFQAWAKDEEGRIYRFAELYHTGLTVEQAATRIKAWMLKTGEDFPQAIICDHDAEGRATLKKHLGVPTIAARKSVSPGLQAVMKRLEAAEDGKPRIFLLRDSALCRDPKLIAAREPTSTEEEFEIYLWQEGVKDSEPVKKHDHGLDALRYIVMHLDSSSTWTAADYDRLEELRAAYRAPKLSQLGPGERLQRYEEEVAEMNANLLRRSW